MYFIKKYIMVKSYYQLNINIRLNLGILIINPLCFFFQITFLWMIMPDLLSWILKARLLL